MSETPYMDNPEDVTPDVEEDTTPVTPDDGDNTNTEEGPDFSTDGGPTFPLDPPDEVDPPIPTPDPVPVEPAPAPPEPDVDEEHPPYYATWNAVGPIVGEDGEIEQIPYEPLPSIKDVLANELEDAGNVSPEDYFFTIQAKELVQIRFGQMLRAIEMYCPMEMDRYPGASTLRNLLKAVIGDLHSLKSSDIGYDGELHREYGTVKGILTYILDTIANISASGVKGEGITIDPTGDTPQFVIDELAGANRLVDVINYIYNNYRYGGVPVPGLEVAIDGGSFKALDFDLTKALDQNGRISAQNLLNRIYKYITQTLDHTKTVKATNTISYILPITEEPIIPVKLNVLAQVATEIEYDIQIQIYCSVPGTLRVIVIEKRESADIHVEFKDAITTGYHVLHYTGFRSVVVAQGDPKKLPLMLELKYYIDTEVEGVSEPARIEVENICFRAKGEHIDTYEEEEGDETA